MKNEIKNKHESDYNRICPVCQKIIPYISFRSFKNADKYNRKCKSCCKIGTTNPFFGKIHTKKTKTIMSTNKMGEKNPKYWLGKTRKFSDNTKKKFSDSQKNRYKNPTEKNNTSKTVKIAMHNTETRKKHIKALHQSKWIKVRTDKGQLELLEKWNRLGFNFEPNFQVKTEIDLFYVDGYDKERNVVIEYDGKYHQKPIQKEKDLIRQQKIAEFLHPKKFWRYDVVNKSWKNII